MEKLQVIETDKAYKYFQFYGVSEGAAVGRVSLNGAVMHEFEGEPTQIVTNAAREALKQGPNVIRVEIREFKKAGPRQFEFMVVATDNPDDTHFSADRVVEFQLDLADAALPWVKEYGFELAGKPFAALGK